VLDVLLAPLVRELVYPRHGTRVAPDASMHELVVDRTTLRGWVVNPGRDRVLLYFGGNGERLDLWQAVVAQQFPRHTTYLMAYRGYGASEGRPSQPALTTDAVALVDHVDDRHPGAPVDVIGRSLGSGVAVQVASQRNLAHVVLVTPFDSLVATAADLVPHAPVASLVEDHWDSAALAPDLGAPVLVVRAGRDAVVRPERTDRLVDALVAPAVVSYPDAGHNDISDDPGYWPAIAAFLDDERRLPG
jgi:uncharacterized protein